MWFMRWTWRRNGSLLNSLCSGLYRVIPLSESRLRSWSCHLWLYCSRKRCLRDWDMVLRLCRKQFFVLLGVILKWKELSCPWCLWHQ